MLGAFDTLTWCERAESRRLMTVGVVWGNERHVEVEPRQPDQPEHVIERRPGPARLEASDRALRRTGPRCQLALGESGPFPRLSHQIVAMRRHSINAISMAFLNLTPGYSVTKRCDEHRSGAPFRHGLSQQGLAADLRFSPNQRDWSQPVARS
jgi:hypothetical protein